MNIGVVGAGKIGGTVGVLWAKAGHLIRFGTRHPESLGPLLAEAGPNASAGSPEEAARFGEIVFCSDSRAVAAGPGRVRCALILFLISGVLGYSRRL